MDKQVERKLLIRVGSLLFLLYVFFSLDRGNMGFAALEMNSAIGVTASLFGVGAGLFTFAYLLFQIPNAMVMRRLGASRGLALVAIMWGVISAASALIWDGGSFLVFRFLLGAAEAGFHAYLIFYISQIFPRRTQGFAIGVTLAAVPLSQVLASPISGVLLDFDTHLRGWQWLFILEGLPSVAMGALCLFLIPNSPQDAKFLTDEERTWLRADLAASEAKAAESGGARNLNQALWSPMVWCLGFVLFANILGVNTLLFWMPQIIKQVTGVGNTATGLLAMLPWATFAAGLLGLARLADRLPNPRPLLCAGLILACLGFSLAAAPIGPYGLFAGLLIAAFGIGAAQGLFWTFAMKRISGPEAATAYGMITIIGNGSGIFAHALIGWARDTTGSFSGVVLALGAFMAMAILVLFALDRFDTSKMARTG